MHIHECLNACSGAKHSLNFISSLSTELKASMLSGSLLLCIFFQCRAESLFDCVCADDLANHYKTPSLVTSASEFDYYRSRFPSYTYAGQFESGHSINTSSSQYYLVSLSCTQFVIRVTYKLCLLTYKCLQGWAPEYLSRLCVSIVSVSGCSRL